MLGALKKFAKGIIRREPDRLPVAWVRRSPEAWLVGRFLAEEFVHPPIFKASHTIEALANETNALGAQKLWSGYADKSRGDTRLPDAVRTSKVVGNIFSQLVRLRQPKTIVEFGTAFGISGMYWLAGLEENGAGCLYTFEPNREWAAIADRNLRRIGHRYKLTVGTFEENVDANIPPGQLIELAFIDAIHTTEFVTRQLDLVIERSAPGAIIVLDDIDFSEDMRQCWHTVSRDQRVIASAALGARVGIVELTQARCRC